MASIHLLVPPPCVPMYVGRDLTLQILRHSVCGVMHITQSLVCLRNNIQPTTDQTANNHQSTIRPQTASSPRSGQSAIQSCPAMPLLSYAERLALALQYQERMAKQCHEAPQIPFLDHAPMLGPPSCTAADCKQPRLRRCPFDLEDMSSKPAWVVARMDTSGRPASATNMGLLPSSWSVITVPAGPWPCSQCLGQPLC